MASNKEKLIDSIMKTKYGSDDPKYDSSNRAFLESLTTRELERLDSEDEFDAEGEVTDFDFDDNELFN